MFLVFVIGIDRTERFGGCVTVSVLIHYFTLASVMWMGAEALFMFQKIVLVFFQATTRYLVVLSIICWGRYLYMVGGKSGESDGEYVRDCTFPLPSGSTDSSSHSIFY